MAGKHIVLIGIDPALIDWSARPGRHAPAAALRFNTSPDDTLDAVLRWI